LVAKFWAKAGDKSGGAPASSPGSGGTTDTGATDSGTTTDSSGDAASDPDSGISPANKYAG